jgi:copper resistance protein C
LKKFILFFICVFIIVPSIVSAHTSLSSSNPSEGQVVTEKLDQILLNYGTSIEELSTMDLVKDGKKIPLADINVENNQLMGRIPEPLDNGSYTIEWRIAGEDGHPIQGEINFSVQMERTESELDSAPPEEGQANQENVSQTAQSDQKSTEEKAANDSIDQPDVQNNDSSTMLITIFVGLIVIFFIVLVWFSIKKKN